MDTALARALLRVSLGALAALWAAVVSGIAAWPVAVAASAALVAALHLERLAPRLAPRLRTLSRPLVVVIAVAGLVGTARAGDPPTAVARMVLLLSALQVLAALTARTRRDLLVVLVMSGCLLLGGTATLTDVLHGLPSLLAWGLLLLAAAAVQQLQPFEDAVQVAALSLATRHDGQHRASGVVASAVVAGVLVGLAGFLVLPGAGAAGLHSRFGGRSTSAGAAGVSRAVAGIDTSGTGQLDLTVRGHLPDTPIARVAADTPPLWRATVYDDYTGLSWMSRATTEGRPFHPTPVSADPSLRTDRVELLSPTVPQVLWAPGAVVGIGPTDAEVSADTFGDVRAMWLPGSSYTVTTRAPAPPAALAKVVAAPTSSPWTALPGSLPARDVALARRIAAGASTRFEVVSAVTTWLHHHATYSLDSPAPKPGQDAVDRFLFVDHVGFCEQFASAETVLLRAVGIPSRLVTGLAYGDPADGTRTFRMSDAHAWVEVWYPGLGWQPADPTAGVGLAAGGTGLDAWVRTVLHRLLTAAPGGRDTVAALLVVLAAAVIAVAVRRRRPQPVTRAREDWQPPPGPVVAAFGVFARRWRPIAPRAPAETAREYVARLGATAPFGVPLAAAVEVLEQECYGDSPPEPRLAVEAVRAFETPGPAV